MESRPGASEGASAVLDIGGDVGAAIVYAPASMTGAEVEIRRRGEPWAGRHVAVRPRRLVGGTTHAALFDRLERGAYEVRYRDSGGNGPVQHFDVDGGRVITLPLTP
jgi:hypothetical protein